MISTTKRKSKSISLNNICKVVWLFFICFIFAFYEKRIYAEIIYIFVFVYYFISKRKQPSIYLLWNLFFVGICALSNLWSQDISQSLGMTRKLFELALMGNLLISFIDTKEELTFIYKSFIGAGIALILRLLISFPISTWGTERLGDSFLNANAIGLYLAISAICSMYIFSIEKKKIYGLAILVFSLVIFLTGSRKAFLMLLIGISGLYYINSKKLVKKIKAIILIALILLISLYLVMNIPEFYNVLGVRLERLVNSLTGTGRDRSAEVRFSLIETGKALFKDRPIWGYGVSTFGIVSRKGMYSHNNYIELLVGVGIVGTIIYYSIYAYIIIKLLIIKKNIYANPLLVIMVLLVVMEYGLVSYYGEFYQMLVAASIGAIKIHSIDRAKARKAVEGA